MAQPKLKVYLDLVPVVLRSPHRFLSSTYDAEADVLYMEFKKPAHASTR
jgi:hypothetical protein